MTEPDNGEPFALTSTERPAGVIRLLKHAIDDANAT